MHRYYKFTYREIIFLALFVLLVSFSTTASIKAEEVKPEKIQEEKEKILPILQKGIEIIKYEIERDELVVSRKMLIPGIRQLRLALKKDIPEKEKLLNNLKSPLIPTISNIAGPLQKTITQERKIVESNQISSRVRRQTRNIIKSFIPIKKDILASLEKALSELL